MSHTLRNALALIGWIIISFSAAATGIIAKPGVWYAALNKPSFNPPNWIFGPVWTLLYLAMGFAAWRVWIRGGFAAQTRPLGHYIVQLGLNAAWPPIFFALHRLDLALLVILVLWIAIFLTILQFRTVDQLASWLLWPYLAWVSFATILNFSLWHLNRA